MTESEYWFGIPKSKKFCTSIEFKRDHKFKTKVKS